MTQIPKKDEDVGWCTYSAFEIYDLTATIIENNSSVLKVEIDDGTIYENPTSGLRHTFKSESLHKVKITLKPDAQSFDKLFYVCSDLVSVPKGFFKNHKNATNFSFTFADCVSLKDTPKDEDGGELWERAGKPGYPSDIDGSYCFNGCNWLLNFDEIPPGWK